MKVFYVICVTCTFTHKLLSLLGIWENLKILTFHFIETSTLEFNLIDDCLFLLLVISSINRLEQGLLTYVPLDRESIYTLTRLSWTTKICLIWKRLIVVHLDIIYINETSILYYQHHMQTNFDWKGLQKIYLERMHVKNEKWSRLTDTVSPRSLYMFNRIIMNRPLEMLTQEIQKFIIMIFK